MIAIPNMDKPKSCDECVKSLDIECCGDIRNCSLIDIVQCKDCIWSYIDKQYGDTMWCKVHFHHYRVNSDGFCSYGERRE